jgi:hypothetical protein
MRYLSASARKRDGKAAETTEKDADDETAQLERIKEAVISGKRKPAVDYTKQRWMGVPIHRRSSTSI